MKEKGKVVDMFSRLDLDDHGQDTAKNDFMSDKVGRFVGAIPVERATEIKKRHTELFIRSQRISAMTRQWQIDQAVHVEDLYNLLRQKGVLDHEFNLDTQDIMVSEDGKVWIVDVYGKDGPLQ